MEIPFEHDKIEQRFLYKMTSTTDIGHPSDLHQKCLDKSWEAQENGFCGNEKGNRIVLDRMILSRPTEGIKRKRPTSLSFIHDLLCLQTRKDFFLCAELNFKFSTTD